MPAPNNISIRSNRVFARIEFAWLDGTRPCVPIFFYLFGSRGTLRSSGSRYLHGACFLAHG
jgi:hypothetical protein